MDCDLLWLCWRRWLLVWSLHPATALYICELPQMLPCRTATSGRFGTLKLRLPGHLPGQCCVQQVLQPTKEIGSLSASRPSHRRVASSSNVLSLPWSFVCSFAAHVLVLIRSVSSKEIGGRDTFHGLLRNFFMILDELATHHRFSHQRGSVSQPRVQVCKFPHSELCLNLDAFGWVVSVTCFFSALQHTLGERPTW